MCWFILIRSKGKFVFIICLCPRLTTQHLTTRVCQTLRPPLPPPLSSSFWAKREKRSWFQIKHLISLPCNRDKPLTGPNCTQENPRGLKTRLIRWGTHWTCWRYPGTITAGPSIHKYPYSWTKLNDMIQAWLVTWLAVYPLIIEQPWKWSEYYGNR